MEHPLIDKKRRFSFILITSLFALWGFANDITNPMVAAFQTLLELSAAKASLIQFAFYGGYATMAIPAALFIRKYSYKRGIQLGLLLYACGPSSSSLRQPTRSFHSSACRSISSLLGSPFWRRRPTPSSSRSVARRPRHAVSTSHRPSIPSDRSVAWLSRRSSYCPS